MVRTRRKRFKTQRGGTLPEGGFAERLLGRADLWAAERNVKKTEKVLAEAKERKRAAEEAEEAGELAEAENDINLALPPIEAALERRKQLLWQQRKPNEDEEEEALRVYKQVVAAMLDGRDVEDLSEEEMMRLREDLSEEEKMRLRVAKPYYYTPGVGASRDRKRAGGAKKKTYKRKKKKRRKINSRTKKKKRRRHK